MPYESITDGLTITVPTSSTQNWGTQLKNLAWKVISGHRHEGSGDGNKIRPQGLSDQFSTVQTLTPTGTSQTINFDLGGTVNLNLGSASGNVTLTLSNPKEGVLYSVKIIQGATVRALTWPAGVLWSGGVEPSTEQNINTTNVVWLRYDGVSYLTFWENEIS